MIWLKVPAAAGRAPTSRPPGVGDVANRGALDRELAQLVAVALHCGDSLGVLLVDLDHFRELNDTRGHQAGDTVLGRRALAAAELPAAGPDRWYGVTAVR